MGKTNTLKKVSLGIGICLLAGALGAVLTGQGLREWYPSLHKPWWTPPNWVFGPVWTVLYILMGIALGLVWSRESAPRTRQYALLWFGLQLALNVGWSAAFFGFQAPGWAYAIIMLLWLAILATMWTFSRISSVAALLLLPYLGWVTFASTLNFQILSLNVLKPDLAKMDADPRNRNAPLLRPAATPTPAPEQ